MTQPVRYRPGEAVRWLQTGADQSRREAVGKGRELTRPEEPLTFRSSVRSVTGVIAAMGKSAMADIAHKRAQATEYALYDDRVEIVNPNSVKSMMFDEIRRIEVKGDRFVVIASNQRLTIKPYAYIVSGKLRVPIGWERNGMEIAYEVFLEELSARADVEPIRV